MTEKQTVAFNLKAREEFKKKTRARMGVWQAIELLNTLVDDSDPDVRPFSRSFRAIITHCLVLYSSYNVAAGTYINTIFPLNISLNHNVDERLPNRAFAADSGGDTKRWEAGVDAGTDFATFIIFKGQGRCFG